MTETRSTHVRNTVPMLKSPRCGARTRVGGSCQSPAVRGKKRCRMHGGAKGVGAPKENQNALKHGTYTKVDFQQREQMRGLFEETRKLICDPGASND